MPQKYMTLKKQLMTPSDPRRLLSAIAKQRYIEVDQKKKLCKEHDRAAALVEVCCTASPRRRRDSSRVHENMVEAEDYFCVVRQRQVRFDRRTINDFYGLRDEEMDMLHLCHEVSLDDLVAYLFPDGVEGICVWSQEFGCILSVRLLPTTHYTEVIVNRSYILYAIMIGHPVNVGLQIQEAMQHTCDTVSRGLYYPSLVTALCEAVGIPVRSSEHIVGPEKPLTMTFIKNVYR
ncbi:hypothetical protein H6P81_006574 [Aristolochia fimbriata]|uniref:Putative plant transposon protein domain-containing protein n=1 Tax=Aristolochia fimbriata TaxID=158543 RepID=A0AAV7EZV4_ARIFI|nr:hypothetical protein H6P81_006574 [Aristolochia fimbriata]